MRNKNESSVVMCLQERCDCFAFNCGECEVLRDTNFGSRVCPFYKTKAEYEEGLKKYPYKNPANRSDDEN